MIYHSLNDREVFGICQCHHGAEEHSIGNGSPGEKYECLVEGCNCLDYVEVTQCTA